MKALKNNQQIKSYRYYSTTPIQKGIMIESHGDACEILYFIGGNADFYIEGNAYRLKKGDIIITRPDEYHLLKLRSSSPYERIVVHFDSHILDNIKNKENLLSVFYNRAKGEENLFSAALYPDNYWFHYMDRINMMQSEDEKLLYLLPLLNDLVKIKEENRQTKTIKNIDHASKIVNYIDAHFTERISLDMLCDKFFISKAQLTRTIKKSTGTTVWNYIHNQRLDFAHELLCEGETPTKACENSGFADYTSFYKAYKKKYNKSPNEARIKRKFKPS